MPSAGFEPATPASEQLHTHALDRWDMFLKELRNKIYKNTKI
jgi:hypothetical protein